MKITAHNLKSQWPSASYIINDTATNAHRRRNIPSPTCCRRSQQSTPRALGTRCVSGHPHWTPHLSQLHPHTVHHSPRDPLPVQHAHHPRGLQSTGPPVTPTPQLTADPPHQPSGESGLTFPGHISLGSGLWPIHSSPFSPGLE